MFLAINLSGPIRLKAIESLNDVLILNGVLFSINLEHLFHSNEMSLRQSFRLNHLRKTLDELN
jgi:hypothetical protein